MQIHPNQTVTSTKEQPAAAWIHSGSKVKAAANPEPVVTDWSRMTEQWKNSSKQGSNDGKEIQRVKGKKGGETNIIRVFGRIYSLPPYKVKRDFRFR